MERVSAIYFSEEIYLSENFYVVLFTLKADTNLFVKKHLFNWNSCDFFISIATCHDLSLFDLASLLCDFRKHGTGIR